MAFVGNPIEAGLSLQRDTVHPADGSLESIRVLGTSVACATYDSALERIKALAREPRATAVCPSNTHILGEARHKPEFAGILARFDLVLPDGMPVESITKGNRLQTDTINRVKGYQNIFAIGDVAATITDETPNGYPGVAPVAIQQGDWLGKNLIHLINKEETEPFKYVDKGSLATIGRNKAVADIGKFHFQGFFAWLVWMFVHLISLLGFRNKVHVFINWIGSYISFNGGSRLIIRQFKKETLADKTIQVSKPD